MKGEKVKRYFRDELSGESTPPIKILPCPKCGKLPSVHVSTGGFNYYEYYKCNDCNLFATGYHEFPMGVYMAMPKGEHEMPTTPKLFVSYEGEHNAENGWNEYVKNTTPE